MRNISNKLDSAIVRLLIILLALSLGFNGILVLKRYEVFPAKKILVERNKKLDEQIIHYRNEINKYWGISEKIDAVIHDANKKIEAKEKQIIALYKDKKMKQNENKRLVSQVDSLQEEYLYVIDSLLVIREQNTIYNNKIQSLEQVVSNLNQKLGVAERLVGDNMVVSPLKVNSSGKKQQTALAKKVAEIDVCFDIVENRVSQPGLKTLYVVIMSPEAKTLVDIHEEEPMFTNPEFKTEAIFTKMEKVNYTNEKVEICANIKLESSIQSGLYVAEIFSEHSKLGMTTFSLK